MAPHRLGVHRSVPVATDHRQDRHAPTAAGRRAQWTRKSGLLRAPNRHIRIRETPRSGSGICRARLAWLSRFHIEPRPEPGFTPVAARLETL